MAISPPSDILLDVANAADPAQVRVATARLAKLASDPAAVDGDFGKALATAAREGKTFNAGVSPNPSAGSSGNKVMASSKGAAVAYQKFEALLLQNFVEAMLPKDDELYGDKESAGVYRSMMAEQFANQLSKAGGIGIAKAIAAKHPAPPPAVATLPGVKPTDA
jgi:hypothetical protein